MASTLNIALVIKLIDGVTGPAKRATNSFAGIRQGWSQMQAQFRKAGEMRQAGEGVATFARKARAMLAAPISAFEDFEAAMSAVEAKTSNITGPQLAQLTAKAKELGATTRYTAKQSAESLEFLAIAGFDTAEQLMIVPHTLNLATAAGSDLGRTSDILSDLMGAFGKEASQAGEVADILTSTFTGSNTTLETLFETMKLAGPVATDMRITMSDVAAMSGIIGSAGIKGSMAGTALRASIQRLIKPSKTATGMLKELGVKTVDSADNMRPLIQIMSEVEKATAGMGSGKRGAYIAEIFGIRASSSVSNLLRAMKTGEVTKFAEEIEKSGGSTKRVAEIMERNAKGATTRLTSAIDGMYIAIGQSLSPALTDLKEQLTEIVSAITIWVGENPRLTKVLAITTGVVALLATALAGMLFTFAALSSAKGVALLAKAFVTDLIPATLATTKTFIAFNATLLTNPIVLAVMAVLALAAAVVLLAVYWHEFAAWWSNMWQKFVEAPLLVKYALVALLGPLLALYSPIIGLAWLARKIYDNWGGIGDWFLELFSDIGEGASGLWEGLKKGASDALGWIMDKIRPVLEAIQPLLSIAGTVAGVALTPFTKGIPALAEFAMGVGSSIVDVLNPSIDSQEKAAKLEIKIDSEGNARMQNAVSTGFNMELDTGFSMETM